MSTAAGVESVASSPARQRESVLGVIGVALGVLALALTAGGLYFLGRPSPPPAAEELLAGRFARAGSFPFGLEVVGAERTLDGREVVRLEGPRAAAFAPKEVREAEAPAPEAEGQPPPVDWNALPVVTGGAPARAALVWYPRSRAGAVLREQFTELRFDAARGFGGPGGPSGPGGSGHGGGGGGGPGGPGRGMGGPGEPPEAPPPKLQDGGTIPWAGYAAPYVRVREFELIDGVGRFVESVRVNLTLGAHCCVLYLRWPPGEAGDREGALTMLAALEPLPDAPSTGRSDPTQ